MDSEDVINHKEFNICFSKKLYNIGNSRSISLLLIVVSQFGKLHADRGKRSETDRRFPMMEVVLDILKSSFKESGLCDFIM